MFIYIKTTNRFKYTKMTIVSDVENNKNYRNMLSHVNFLSYHYNVMMCWHCNDVIGNLHVTTWYASFCCFLYPILLSSLQVYKCKKLNSLKLRVRTTWQPQTSKTAKIFWVTLDAAYDIVTCKFPIMSLQIYNVMMRWHLHLYLLFYGRRYRTVSVILLLNGMMISYTSPTITISLSLSMWSQFTMQASTCCIPRNQEHISYRNPVIANFLLKCSNFRPVAMRMNR